jgi:A/G-specific adenine glycosylase
MPDTVIRESAAAASLLAWYDRHRRDLPWRAAPGDHADPYGVWLSEIMLQQTTVAAAKPYYEKFLAAWPTVADLAAADLDDILTAWAGLGYYARARNLHACARTVVDEHAGRFPDAEDELRALPGIGVYTAAAVAAIAFDRPAVVVDGNVERVMARLFAVETPLPATKAELRELAAGLSPRERPGDYAQAVMDLGATVCTPTRPHCGQCPWTVWCVARKMGIAESLPRRERKAAKPVRRGVVFWVERPDGAVLLRRRPPKGLLGGMVEIPSTPWTENEIDLANAKRHAPAAVRRWANMPGEVRHTFTHFHLELKVLRGKSKHSNEGGMWVLPDHFSDHALPSVMRKVIAHALR